MDKFIYGADTETCEGPPISFQFYSEDCDCDEILWVKDPRDTVDILVRWCAARKKDVGHVVYVHNLDFDAVSFFYADLKPLATAAGEFEIRKGRWTLRGCYGTPTFFTVSNGKGITVWFVDSYSWFASSLAKAADLFCPDLPKLTRPRDLGKIVYTARDTQFCEYAMRDAVIAYHMGRAIEAVHREFDIGQSVSLANMAAKIFRRDFVRETIPVPADAVYRAALDAYHGGKNLLTVERGWYSDVSALDISSAYPDAMASFPSFTEAKAYRTVRAGPGTRSVPDLGVYCIRGSVAPCRWPIVYDRKFKPVEPGSISNVWITGHELNEALRSREVRLDAVYGYAYDVDREPSGRRSALAAYVAEFYRRKSTEKDPVKRHTFKILLNALYGKFIQTKKEQLTEDHFDEQDRPFEVRKRIVAGPMFHPFIASLITGHTRARIHQLEHQYKALHTATDGIITRQRIGALKGNGLGSLGVEAQGDVCLLRNKLYLLYGAEGDRSIFAGKHVAKYARHGYQGSMRDLEIMVASGRRRYVVERPNRLKESVKRGLTPNRFERRVYILKVGDLPVH